jgi:hypothetical protein
MSLNFRINWISLNFRIFDTSYGNIQLILVYFWKKVMKIDEDEMEIFL